MIELYLAGRRRSELIRDAALLAADKLHADILATADREHRRAGPLSPEALAALTRAGAVADDARQSAYDRAATEHQDRLAALQRRFGQACTSRGNPDAPRAVEFLRNIDPEGGSEPVTVEPGPLRRRVLFGGVSYDRPVDRDGRIMAEPNGVEPRRQTFAPKTPGEFMAAKIAGTMTPEEQQPPASTAGIETTSRQSEPTGDPVILTSDAIRAFRASLAAGRPN